ncbi:hypothetical protein [Sediminibacterium sp. TEGAF015]|uniref:hypothetical protein n=1 Tax=Sediminibacterium sp. TEGAF015 TaxID=575378 RepID=UPI00220C5194|nr:hypothetical protein [Sediminibacterium sp. TEGAF015]BDQ12913.1 hypothetical protein TEGAF0_21300 [Sediminibacterium sp. TEGAF015]
MYKVLVACLENWDTLMELPFVLTEGGCSVDVFCSKNSWLLKNKFYKNWIECPSENEEYKKKLLEIAFDSSAGYNWIILGDEKLLKMLSECDELKNNEAAKKVLPITDLKNKVLMGSKYGLCRLCEEYGFKTPAFFGYFHQPMFNPDSLPLKFPILLKQDLSWGGGGIIQCNSASDFKLAFQKLNPVYPYVFQELIEGKDIGVEALFNNGVLLNYNAGEVKSYFKSKFSFTTKRSYFLNEEIRILLEKIGAAFTINGFASIQFIYNELDNQYYLIECDLRPNFYIPYGRFTGQDFSEAIKKKINPNYQIAPNTKLANNKTIEVALFYRDIIKCLKRRDLLGLLQWVINYKGYWRFIPLYDFKLFKNMMKELCFYKLLNRKH